MRVRIVLASPSDVLLERKLVASVIERLNRHFADQNTHLTLYEWETSASPGFHREGRQSRIDDALKIEESDLFIGIMWKKFGTPVHDAGSGTEHEFNVAYSSFLKSDKPQILFYFKKVNESELTRKELPHYRKVKKFRERFPKEGLWWMFETEAEFERQLYDHIKGHVEFLLRPRLPLTPQPILRPEIREPGTSVLRDNDSQPVDNAAVRKAWTTRETHRYFYPLFARPWRISLALTLLVLMILSLYWFLNFGANLDAQFARIIQEDVDATSPTVTLFPHANVRGGGFQDEVNKLPPGRGRLRVRLIVLSLTKDSELYDVTLLDERSDIQLAKVTGLPVRDQAVSFSLNRELLHTGRYRFMLSRDNVVVQFYSIATDRSQK